MFVEGLVRRFHTQVLVENQQRRDRLDNGVGIIARLLKFLLGVFERFGAVVRRRAERRKFADGTWLCWRAIA